MDVWVPMSSNANGSSILHCLLENPRLRASRYLEVEIDINDKKYVFYRQPHYRCCMQKKIEFHPYDLDALVFYPILDERLEAACCGLYYLLVYHSWFILCLNTQSGTISHIVCWNASFSLSKHNFASLRHERDLFVDPIHAHWINRSWRQHASQSGQAPTIISCFQVPVSTLAMCCD